MVRDWAFATRSWQDFTLLRVINYCENWYVRFCCFNRIMSEMVRSACPAACSFIASCSQLVCGYRKQVLGVLPDSTWWIGTWDLYCSVGNVVRSDGCCIQVGGGGLCSPRIAVCVSRCGPRAHCCLLSLVRHSVHSARCEEVEIDLVGCYLTFSQALLTLHVVFGFCIRSGHTAWDSLNFRNANGIKKQIDLRENKQSPAFKCSAAGPGASLANCRLGRAGGGLWGPDLGEMLTVILLCSGTISVSALQLCWWNNIFLVVCLFLLFPVQPKFWWLANRCCCGDTWKSASGFFSSGGVACLLAVGALETAKNPPELMVDCCSPSPFQETLRYKHKLMSAPLPTCVFCTLSSGCIGSGSIVAHKASKHECKVCTAAPPSAETPGAAQ